MGEGQTGITGRVLSYVVFETHISGIQKLFRDSSALGSSRFHWSPHKPPVRVNPLQASSAHRGAFLEEDPPSEGMSLWQH